MQNEIKKVTFVIKGRLDGLNEYTKACRGNKFAGASMKEKNEKIIVSEILRSKNRNEKISGKVYIKYKWYEPNKRRDFDNIAFAKKFIQDALVTAGVLSGDGWANIVGFSDEFYVDKKTPRVEVEILKEG